MPMFRHHNSLKLQTDFGPPPPDVIVRVRPVDGDSTADHQQNWRTIIALQRQGTGTVRCKLFTSYDKLNWFLLNTYEVSGAQDYYEQIGWMDAFGPLIKVTFAIQANGTDAAPTMRASVGIASDGPFSVVPG